MRPDLQLHDNTRVVRRPEPGGRVSILQLVPGEFRSAGRHIYRGRGSSQYEVDASVEIRGLVVDELAQ